MTLAIKPEHRVLARLVDYIFPNSPDTVLGVEFRYAGSSRRMDAVELGTVFRGYEIKSESDNLARLDAQISTASRYFEELIVCCASPHLPAVIEYVPVQVGVIVFDPETMEFRTHRHPTQTALPRQTLLEILGARRLKSLTSGAPDTLPYEVIREAALATIKTRLQPRWRAFLQERGSQTHPDDLWLLAGKHHERKIRKM